MDSQLIASLVKDVLIPEIAIAIRAHHAATGQLPSDAQVLAALQLDADRVIGIGQAFLARTAPTTGA